jgi:hypothetical protein
MLLTNRTGLSLRFLFEPEKTTGRECSREDRKTAILKDKEVP